MFTKQYPICQHTHFNQQKLLTKIIQRNLESHIQTTTGEPQKVINIANYRKDAKRSMKCCKLKSKSETPNIK